MKQVIPVNCDFAVVFCGCSFWHHSFNSAILERIDNNDYTCDKAIPDVYRVFECLPYDNRPARKKEMYTHDPQQL